MDLVRVRPVKVSHEGLSQLAPDTRVSDGGSQISPVAVEHQPGTAPVYVQGDGLEVLWAVWMAAGFQERPERGPVQVYCLLAALHAIEAVSGDPCELEPDPVAPLVQTELQERMDVVGDDAAVAPEAVKLVVGDIEPLRGFHPGADGAELDGILVGVSVEQDSICHG